MKMFSVANNVRRLIVVAALQQVKLQAQYIARIEVDEEAMEVKITYESPDGKHSTEIGDFEDFEELMKSLLSGQAAASMKVENKEHSEASIFDDLKVKSEDDDFVFDSPISGMAPSTEAPAPVAPEGQTPPAEKAKAPSIPLPKPQAIPNVQKTI